MSVLTDTTVIVPVFNAARTLAACIDSLLALDPQPAEIIVVDNGSQDTTPGILATYEGRIRLIHEPQRGASIARNAGILAARGSRIALTDADCIVAPNWLAAITKPLSDPSIGVVGGHNRATEPRHTIARYGEAIFDHRFAIEEAVPPYVASLNWASRRDVLLQCGLFDPERLRGQDVEFSHRILAAGYRLHYAPDAVIYHENLRSWLQLGRAGFQHGYYVADLFDETDVPARRARTFLRRRWAALQSPTYVVCDWIFTSGRIVGLASGTALRAWRSATGHRVRNSTAKRPF